MSCQLTQFKDTGLNRIKKEQKHWNVALCRETDWNNAFSLKI